MRKQTTVITLIIALFLLSPTLLVAGANETPGVNGRPHKFGCFMANTFEFGRGDLAIFRKYVVNDQHYAFGARYEDTALDASFGGGGIMNFVNFCKSGKLDVMLVTAHGDDLPSTLVEMYAPTPAGETARNAAFDSYDLLPGTIITVDYPGWAFTIEATQNFYGAYLFTPQAFAWWATCWSSRFNMTGVGEARVYLGYDHIVWSSKCYCDEERILRRMDGQEGQLNRPLLKAAAGINGVCPPGGANLVIQGKQNTVLSPSVLDHEPKGAVCTPTPGFLKFDTTMDTSVDPRNAVKAYGDGYLTSHAWASDDKLTFTVIPTSIPALILYSGEEYYCRSKANHARLDGNTLPPVNAKGPNRDDYLWTTYCPATPPSKPSTPSTPAPPSAPSTPGTSTPVSTPISNGSGTTTTVTVTLTDQKGWCTQDPVVLTMAPDEVQMVFWTFDIPANAVAGELDLYTVEVASDGGETPFFAYGQLAVDSVIRARLIGNRYLKPGYINELELLVENA